MSEDEVREDEFCKLALSDDDRELFSDPDIAALALKYFNHGKAAQSLNKPVPIDDPIIETWKDGRTVVLFLEWGSILHATWSTEHGGIWKAASLSQNVWPDDFCFTLEHLDKEWPEQPEFAMLPPSIKEVSHD